MTVRVFLLTLLACLPLAARAQDPFADPFGSVGQDPFGSEPSAASTTNGFGDFGTASSPMVASAESRNASAPLDVLLSPPNPIVRMIRETPPQTAEEFGQAIAWLVRLKEWTEAKRLLDAIGQADWTLQQQTAAARAAGPAILGRLLEEEAELTDRQKQVVWQLQRAPGKYARSPEILDQWIDRLVSTSPAIRQKARLRLQDAGEVAVQRLLDRLLAGDPRIAPGVLVRATIDMGQDGVDALRAALLIEAPERVERVAIGLAEQPDRALAIELGALLVGGPVPEQVTSQVASLLQQRYRTLPDRDRVLQFLERETAQRLAEYQDVRLEPNVVPERVWRVTTDRQAVEVQQGAAADAALERLANLAALRFDVLNAHAGALSELSECGAILLQRAYHLHPQVEDTALNSHLLTELTVDQVPSDDFLISVFHAATDKQFHGAALRAVQQLGSHGTATSATVGFLSDLLNDPRPVIRYSALEALDRLDPQRPFAGTDQAMATAVEMARLTTGPHVLVVGLSPDLRQTAMQQLTSVAGAEVTTANTMKSALLALDQERPAELILVVDRVPDDSVLQLLQRLRRAQRGHALPIGVLTDNLYPHERDWIDHASGIVSGLLTRQPENMRVLLNRLWSTMDITPLSSADRLRFAAVGERFLARIAHDRETYAIYPVEQWSATLASLAGQISAPSLVQIFVGVPTAQAQEELVELAARRSLDESTRLAAAHGFLQSLQRHGLLLPRHQVLRCYELYNRLGPDDPVAVRALGFILDVLEAHAAGRELPAPPADETPSSPASTVG
ncbi:MAG: hypothetical protein KatS3mg111_1570 [Pirellulaceae bacterium]|nr:MAG: hypothetical protein KatS3mg111_1570 [Pirellulaceae bacterium]